VKEMKRKVIDGAEAPKIEAVDIEDNTASKEGVYYADLLVRTEDEYIENADGIWDELKDLLDQVFVGRVVLNIRPGNAEEIEQWRGNLYDEVD
jgi:hypothetical protein